VQEGKQIRPALKALTDTWVFPTLTVVLAGVSCWPGGGDLLLRGLTCLGCVLTVVAYLGSLRLQRRRQRWQHHEAVRLKAWQREEERRHAAWQRTRFSDESSLD
jgi:hypothetical protein